MNQNKSLEKITSQESRNLSKTIFKNVTNTVNYITGTALSDFSRAVWEGLGYNKVFSASAINKTVPPNSAPDAASDTTLDTDSNTASDVILDFVSESSAPQRGKSLLSALRKTFVAASAWYLIWPWYVATHEALHADARKIISDRPLIVSVNIDTTYVPHGDLIETVFPHITTHHGGKLRGKVHSYSIVTEPRRDYAIFSLAPYLLAPLGIYLFRRGIKTKNSLLMGTSLSYASSQFYQITSQRDIGYTVNSLLHIPESRSEEWYLPLAALAASSLIYGISKLAVKGVEAVFKEKEKADFIPKSVPITRSKAIPPESTLNFRRKVRDTSICLGLYGAVGLAAIPFCVPTDPDYEEEISRQIYAETITNGFLGARFHDSYKLALEGLERHSEWGSFCSQAALVGGMLVQWKGLSPEQFRTDLSPYAGEFLVDQYLEENSKRYFELVWAYGKIAAEPVSSRKNDLQRLFTVVCDSSANLGSVGVRNQKGRKNPT